MLARWEEGCAESWLLLAALSVGLRQGEVLGLRWGDVDLDRRVPTVNVALAQRSANERSLEEPRSARSQRTIPLPAQAVVALREQERRQAEARAIAGGL